MCTGLNLSILAYFLLPSRGRAMTTSASSDFLNLSPVWFWIHGSGIMLSVSSLSTSALVPLSAPWLEGSAWVDPTMCLETGWELQLSLRWWRNSYQLSRYSAYSENDKNRWTKAYLVGRVFSSSLWVKGWLLGSDAIHSIFIFLDVPALVQRHCERETKQPKQGRIVVDLLYQKEVNANIFLSHWTVLWMCWQFHSEGKNAHKARALPHTYLHTLICRTRTHTCSAHTHVN